MKHEDAQSNVLERMAVSRARLIAARQSIGASSALRVRRGVSNVGPWLLRTPNAALVTALLVGLVVLGPRRALQTALQAGLTTWTTSTVRAFAESLKS